MDALRSHVQPAIERFQQEPPFHIGGASVDPEAHEITIDGKRERIQPQPLRVLLLLHEHQGHVVTRDDIIEKCWDRRIVGDDVINRSILILRRIADRAGGFRIETIPKAGYRLIEDEVAARRHRTIRPIFIGAVAIGAVALGFAVTRGPAAWRSFGANNLPLVAIQAADPSPGARGLSRDLFVKLGTLSNVGSGQWRLVENGTAGPRPDFVFRTAGRNAGGEARANLVLLSGKDGTVLWAREFELAASREIDLRQHVSLTAGRVLGCMLNARQEGGLRSDLLRLFLNGCAASAETSGEDPVKIVGTMRAIIAQRPDFSPAWALLLPWERTVYQLAPTESARAELTRDLARARRAEPGLPEIGLAELDLLPPTAYAKALDLLAGLKAKNLGEPDVWAEDATRMASVGRMSESIVSARRAAELDPLSPAISGQLVQTLAWAGATAPARHALDQAENMWPGTAALRDAQYAFHLRYGDPRIAQSLMTEIKDVDGRADAYLLARLDPSPANLAQLAVKVKECARRADGGSYSYAVQALGEFGLVDDAYRWLDRYSAREIAASSYLLFRPGMASVRRDPRFMRLAKRIGLVDYWESSGRWPDFCSESGLPYNCAEEAAKLRP